MKKLIPWMLLPIIIQFGHPLHGQLAVAVVSDAAESMTNVQRFRQYALEAEQYLREIEYWVETGNQLYHVIDRLGGPNSFWTKMGALLDGVDMGRRLASDMEWGDAWYPDDYLRMLRATNQFGHGVDQRFAKTDEGESTLGRHIGNAAYFMAASVAYMNSMGEILETMGRVDQELWQKAVQVSRTPVSDEEGLAGVLEKEIALQMLGISTQGTTNSLLRTMIQAQLEAVSQEQQNQLVQWEYQQAREEEDIRRYYQRIHNNMESSMRRAQQSLEQERRRLSHAEPVVVRERVELTGR